MKLENKVTLITGGSKGIGRSIAVAFSEKEVLLVRLENKPGTMADVTIKISNKGINLTYAFAVAVDAEHSILLIGSEDNEAALKVISS